LVESIEEALPSLSGISLLVLDDEPGIVRSLTRVLGGLGADIIGVSSLREARLSLKSRSPDALLADLQLKDGTGLELLSEYLGGNPDGAFYMITGHGSIDNAVEALRHGARH
jgi:DNA-binding NtrC family response regulator